MPNPLGINGTGKKEYPPDDKLKEALMLYARRKHSQEVKRTRLAADLGLTISIAKLNQLERKFGIPSSRRPGISLEEQKQAILDEASKDLMQNNSPNYVKAKLKDKDIHVPRDLAREVMHEYFPEGAEKRFPGRRKAKVKRQPLVALGPYHEVSADGHEKIGALALQMGGIGLPIYGYRDKWSGKLLKITVVPDCRSNASVGHLFLDLVEQLGGIPLQLNLDQGSEIGWEVAFQIALRQQFSSKIDPSIYPEVALLKSVHNIIIEALWHWLREKAGFNLLEIILRGKEEGLIKPEIPNHRYLFYWIFVGLVQAELDDFRVWWNQRVVRHQPSKMLPSGHVPDDAVEHPQFYGGINCLVEVPTNTVDTLREYLEEEAGPRSRYSDFYPADFATLAADVFEAVQAPSPTLFNAWAVFTSMSEYMEANHFL